MRQQWRVNARPALRPANLLWDSTASEMPFTAEVYPLSSCLPLFVLSILTHVLHTVEHSDPEPQSHLVGLRHYHSPACRTGRLLCSTQFSSGAASLLLLPEQVDQGERRCLVGFHHGTLRSLVQCADGWRVASAVKPQRGER